MRDGLTVGPGLEGFQVDAVSSTEDARAGLSTGEHAGVILDIGLPDGSGLDLLAEWRRAEIMIPVLLLTARNLVTDRVDGLDAAADDYLGKPFDLSELAARVRAMLRRGEGRASDEIVLGVLAISIGRREVALAGVQVPVSRREFAILHALAEHPGHVLSRGPFESRIYGWQEEVQSNAVEVHIHKLRAKLGRERIETVRGEGFPSW
ncbi:winged helix-turn-helix domain-containing protein [Sphingomonas jeddahensis]|uniref:Transcriptional regulatory protein BasR n=1 Tax=Sphingomonas jeddahensis TaxID=1915074 RepID=A0A1V2ET60_9SPHN|nr:winged helix-turn-helix domain-containing protein [Sphingomonas jeddahensis]ONF95733.1 Transcriptional regulatory protein BasR [Sphingomonas jeddahensis]